MFMAKKCKHCGEWLPDEGQCNVSTSGQMVEHLPSFLSGWVSLLLFYVGFAAEVISVVRDFVDFTGHVSKFGKLGTLTELALYVPEWMAALCSGIVWCLFSAALMQGMKRYPAVSSLAVVSFVLTLFNSVLLVIVNESEVISLLGLPIALIGMIISIILGVKLKNKFEGALSSLGGSMLLYSIASFLCVAVAFFLEEWIYAVMAVLAIYLYTILRYLSDLCDIFR